MAQSPPRTLAESIETYGDPSGVLGRHGAFLIDDDLTNVI